MFKLKVIKKFASILANVSLLLNSFLPFALAAKPAFAQSPEPLESTIEYNQSTHSFHLEVNTNEKLNYQLVYKTDDQTESVTADEVSQDPILTRDIYAGTCSGSDCLPHNIKQGILKVEVPSQNWIYSQYFDFVSSSFQIFKSENSSQYDLTDEEIDFIDNGRPAEITPTPTPELNSSEENNDQPTETPIPTAIPTVTVTPTVLGDTTQGEIETKVVPNNQSRTDTLNPTLFTDKDDYAPTEMAIITGTGFEINSEYFLHITADNLDVTYRILSNENGEFTYSYQLDGTYRPDYQVEVKDLTGSVIAGITFTDTSYSVDTYDDSSYNHKKNSFKTGDTVYGKGTRSSKGDIRLIYIDPDGNTQKICDPSWDSKETTCDYILPANQGKWKIEVQERFWNWFSWDWKTKESEDFNQADPSWPDCSYNCTANDVTVTKMELVSDLNGSALNCTPGNNVTAYIKVTYDNHSTDRYAIYLVGDVYEDGNFKQAIDSQASCVDHMATGFDTKVIPTGFNWNCGSSISVKNLVLSWDTNTNTCNNFFTQLKCNPPAQSYCNNGLDYIVTTPLVANFTANDVCLGDPTTFAGSGTGGKTPYTNFSWDFDDGSNGSGVGTTHIYSVAGSYDVKLTVTDSTPQSDDETKTINVNLCATCGDGVKNQPSEECDGTDGVPQHYTCTESCTLQYVPYCGDSITDTNLGETCDDGNTDNSDGCLNTCRLATCGDGFTWLGNEECDDGNQIENDTCTNSCTLPKCGDGIINQLSEQCDDGNSVNTDACTNTCQNAYCGDGIVGPNEECDDANLDNTDSCTNSCNFATCGDGFVQAGEQCDGTADCNANCIFKPGTLIVNKIISGGTKTYSDFSFKINGGANQQFDSDGQNEYTLEAGTYGVIENTDPDYTTTYNNCSNISLIPAGTQTCTITNTRKTGRLYIDKVIFVGPATQSSWNFTVKSLGGTVLGTLIDDGIHNYIDLPTGQYTVTESNNIPGYTFSSVSGACSNKSGFSATATVGTGNNTCTFRNDRDSGFVKVNKQVDLNGDGDFDDSNENNNDYANTLGFRWQINNGSNYNMGMSSSATWTTVPGVSYSVTENSITGYHYIGWTSGSSCNSLSGTGYPVGVTVTKNNTTTITLCNARDTGSVRVNKYTDLNGDGDWNDINETNNTYANNLGFRWQIDGGSDNNMGSTVSHIVIGNHNISEYIPSNYHFVSWYINGTGKSCSNPNGTTLPISTNVLKDTTNTIVLCNARDMATITIDKVTNPTASSQQFNIDLNQGLANDPTLIHRSTLTDQTTPDTYRVPSGEYWLQEQNTNDWYLSNATCVANGDTAHPFDPRNDGFVLNNNDNIVCTFTNTKYASITVDKVTNPSGDPQSFAFNLQRSGDQPIEFNLADQDTPYTNSQLIPDTYSLSETLPDHWTATSQLCTINDSPIRTGLDSIQINAGDVISCVFTNTKLSDIHGYKFNDMNGNGSKDEGEELLDGWTIFIDQNKNGILDNQEQSMITSSTNDHFGWYWFEDLEPGEYQVCEVSQIGWNQTSSPICHTVTLPYESGRNTCDQPAPNYVDAVPTCNFGNQQLGKVTVYKFNDLNGNGQKDEGEENLPNWTINLTDQTSRNTDDNGQVVFDNLVPGEYDLSEIVQSENGWKQTNIYCEDIGNGVKITAPNYAYGHHGNCEGWNTCGDAATCALKACQANGYSNLVSYGDQKPCTQFANCSLFYDINSNLDYQADWGNWCNVMGVTDIVCSNSSGLNDSYSNGYVSGNHLTVNSGQNKVCYIGNQRLEPQMNISKSNNTGGSQLSPGNSVEYTITLGFTQNSVKNLKVTDLLSDGFKYQIGSYKVFKNGNDVTAQISEPQYHSPGVWDLTNLGELTPSDIIELVYTADISTDQQAGKYADLAYASALYAYNSNQSLLASSNSEGYVAPNFVGTEVIVNRNLQDSVSAEVEQKTTGQVLGASTELPGTGAATIWMIISSLLGLLGFGFLKINKKTMLTILLALLSLSFLTKPVLAVSSISVRLEEPKTPSRIKDIELKFVALDLDGNPITAKCFKKGPTDSNFNQFGSDISLSAGGNASQCDLSLAITDNGSYQFKVTGNGVDSNVVDLDYNTSTPGTPIDYRKEQINNCDFKIHFKTADDGGKTVKVELYRSTDSNFSANNESLVHSVTIGSNQEADILNNVPDCSKTYYFALRAFDSAGNGSGLVGDKIYTTTTETITTTSQTTGQNLGAIPVTGTNISPEETGTEDNSQVSTEEDNGQVLGTKTNEGNFFSRHPVTTVLIVVLVLGIIIYAFKKISKGKKIFVKKRK